MRRWNTWSNIGSGFCACSSLRDYCMFQLSNLNTLIDAGQGAALLWFTRYRAVLLSQQSTTVIFHLILWVAVEIVGSAEPWTLLLICLIWSSTTDSDTIKWTILLLTVPIAHLKLLSHEIPPFHITVTIELELSVVKLVWTLLLRWWFWALVYMNFLPRCVSDPRLILSASRRHHYVILYQITYEGMTSPGHPFDNRSHCFEHPFHIEVIHRPLIPNGASSHISVRDWAVSRSIRSQEKAMEMIIKTIFSANRPPTLLNKASKY